MKIKTRDLARITDQNGRPLDSFQIGDYFDKPFFNQVITELNIPDDLVQKKPIVPDYVAHDIKKLHNYYKPTLLLLTMLGEGGTSPKTNSWVLNNALQFCQAVLTNNYEVEGKYHIKVPNTDDSYFVKASDLASVNAYPSETAFTVPELSQFTDDEIVKYDLQNYKKETVMEDENN